MSELPPRWMQVRIRDYVIPFKTIDPTKQPDSYFDYVDIGSIDNLNQTIGVPKRVLGKDAPSRARRQIQVNDTLFSTVRTYLKNVALVPEALDGAVTSTGITVLRPGPHLDPKFLFNWVRSPEFLSKISTTMDGTMYPAVTDGDVLDEQMPLPPLDEQRRIVAKLDNLFTRSKSARDELANIPRLVERTKKAILTAAFRGDLTADWRVARGMDRFPEIRSEISEPYYMAFHAPRAWKETAIDGICSIIGGSQPPKATFKYHLESGYIRLIQIRDYKTDERLTFIPQELAKRFCSKDDVMIGRYGPPIFQILRGLEGAYNVALMKAEPKDGCSKEFLFWRLQDPDLRKYVEMGSDRTAGQDGVNKGHLLKYPVYLPEIEEQLAIVKRLKVSLAQIAHLAVEASHAAALLDRLEQATLTKAFRGELLPAEIPEPIPVEA